MKIVHCLLAAAGAACLASAASAQTWNAQQGQVWTFISSAWEQHADPDTWHEVVDPAGYGWTTDYPMPTNRETMARRSGVFGAEGRVLFYRLDPVAITVNGDTAVAHYYANVVETDHEGKRQNATERCTDTLVRRNNQWRFLGWMCHRTTQQS